MQTMAVNNISYIIYPLSTRIEKGYTTKMIPFFFCSVYLNCILRGWKGGPVTRLTTQDGWRKLLKLAVLSRSAIAMQSNFLVALFVLSLSPFDISVGVGAFFIRLFVFVSDRKVSA